MGRLFVYLKIKPSLTGGVFYMGINTYMDLFGNQEICLIFVEIKTGSLKTE